MPDLLFSSLPYTTIESNITTVGPLLILNGSSTENVAAAVTELLPSTLASTTLEPKSVTLSEVKSSEFCVFYELFVSVILVSITGVIGAVGNILTLVVLHYTKNHSVTVFLLNALAISDLVFIVFTCTLMALPGVCTTADCPDPLLNVIAIIEDYGWALASMAHTINVYITVLVTVHRYITVCLPPHFAARFSTHKQAWIQLGFVCIFGILYNIPRIFEYTVEKDQIHRKVTPYGKNIWYQVLYKNICYV